MDFSQEKLAIAANVSRQTIQNLDKGLFPTPKILIKLAHTFNIQPIELLTRKPKSLEEYRWVKGLSATEAAKKIGISQTSLTRIESKKTDLTLSKALLLSQLLDLTVEEVIDAYNENNF